MKHKNIKKLILSGIAICMLFIMSCGKDDIKLENVDPIGLHKVGEQDLGNIRIIVWGDQSIETGYEKLYLQLFDQSNFKINGGQVNLIPMMEMNMNGEKVGHSAPTDPVKLNSDGFYEGASVFTMSSDGEHGKWTLNVIYTSNNNEVTSFEVPIQVKASTEAKVKTLVSENGTRYVLSLYLSESPKIGINEARFILHKLNLGSELNKSYSPYESATIKVHPHMPDMDNHGSPNNVNPVYKGEGQYLGKLNYTMSGLWRVSVELSIEGEKIETFFDLKF